MPIFLASTTPDAMTTLGTAVTAIFGWMKNVADVVLSNPLYLLFLGVAVTGAAIGLVYRLIHG